MYLIIASDATGFDNHVARHHSLKAAKEHADRIRNATGQHFYVIQVKSVWSTLTLHDLMQEDRQQKV